MKSLVLALAAVSSVGLICVSSSFAAPDDWDEGPPGKATGANRDYYNRAAGLRWRNDEGDWRDAEGVPQGPKPFAVASVARGQTDPVEFDVTGLVRDWVSGKTRNKGFHLRSAAGSTRFHSREAEDSGNRPQLKVVVGRQPHVLPAVADTHIVGSTHKSQGSSKRLSVSGNRPALIRFDLSELEAVGNNAVQKATLRLVPADSRSGQVAVFACDQGEEIEDVEPQFGIAAKYPGDKGIENDPDVLFATGFEAENWLDEWSGGRGQLETTDQADPKTKFEPLQGKACSVLLAKGNSGAMNVSYSFQKEHGSEPEEIYFRYYLRFGDDWNQTVQGGKMPGIAGTYNNAGWGGRKVNGKNGWSARGSFALTFPESNPLAGKQRMGWYCYHADMPGFYGSQWVWSEGYRGYLDNNKWYCVDQYCKLNTLNKEGEEGNRDGILRAWIDGKLAFEKTDVRFRDVDKLKIERIWMNVYHGGTQKSPYDQHLYIDNVVIAKKYIGPMKETVAAE